jgi:hypothetical protein
MRAISADGTFRKWRRGSLPATPDMPERLGCVKISMLMIPSRPSFPTRRFKKPFSGNPTHGRSLLSPHSQALLFSMVSTLRPRHVFEIGTFRAVTSQAIARAMHANGTGTLHTVDPFGIPEVHGILFRWPRELRRHVRFYPMDSMAFAMEATRLNLASGLDLH